MERAEEEILKAGVEGEVGVCDGEVGVFALRDLEPGGDEVCGGDVLGEEFGAQEGG